MKDILVKKLYGKIDEFGFMKTEKIIFSEELIENCKLNHCGKYNKSWMCPPALGNQHELVVQYKAFIHVFVMTKIARLEDPFDWEGMEKGRGNLELVLAGLRPALKSYDYKMLGPGACSICKVCSYPDAPCRHPELAIPSLEALGINVLNLANSCGLKYYNGPNTVTYFAAIFFN